MSLNEDAVTPHQNRSYIQTYKSDQIDVVLTLCYLYRFKFRVHPGLVFYALPRPNF